jgi:hypothetical protein
MRNDRRWIMLDRVAWKVRPDWQNELTEMRDCLGTA